MRTFLAVFALMALTSSVSFSQELDLANGEGPFIRIQIGSETSRDSRELTRRVHRLERAVRDLQNRVYNLEDNDREMRFMCSYEVCRRSASIHASSVHNCTFFKIWKTEEKIVWSLTGSEALESAKQSLAEDTDVVAHRSISCDR